MEIEDNDLRSCYENSPKEKLIAYLLNQDYTVKLLEKKIAFLTGCPSFGNSDSTDETCVECFYHNHELFEKCNKFQRKYWNEWRNSDEIMA